MIDPNKDGISFINVYSKGRTNLGKQLTNMFPYSFMYDGIQFNSVEQAWHYYKFVNIDTNVANHILTLTNPFECLKYARANKTEAVVEYVKTSSFQSKMKDVINTRISSDNTLKTLLRNSWLPFEHFYTYGKEGSKQVVHDQRNKYEWLLDIFDDIRFKLHTEYLDDLLSKYGNLCHNMRTAPLNAIYAGRPKSGAIAVYGNPFPVDAEFKRLKNTDNHVLFNKAVALSVMEFRNYLFTQIKTSPELWYKHLKDIQGKPLKCFCTNGTLNRSTGGAYCHTLILAQFSDNLDTIYKYLGINI